MKLIYKLKHDNATHNIILLENEIKLYEYSSTDDALSYIYSRINKYAPLSVYFELTNCCNFKCPFCYINYSDDGKKFLNTKELIKNIDYLCDKGMVSASLSGGECLMHPDFKKIYSYLHNKEVLIAVLTNGVLINDDIIKLFKEKKPYKVEISLYGSNNNLMKKNTKQDSWGLDDLKTNILKLKKNDINVICKMPINKVTSSSFFEIYEWCKEHNIPFYYSDELFNRYDGSCNNKYLLDDTKIKNILEDDKYLLYRQMNFNLNKKKKCFDCKAGKYSMVMSYDNSIYPCFEFRQIKDGVFDIGNNIDIAYNKLKDYIKSYKDIILSYCNGCNAYSICQDCVINHINGKSNCTVYREEREKILKRLAKENEELIRKYDTKELTTNRLIIKKGTSKDCIKIYEYDMLKCRGIGGEEVIEKVEIPIDFIGADSDKYYEECAKNKMFDWYVYLKDGTPIANITADREIKDINSIELSFNMHPNYWRKGYMKEAVSRVIDYLFEIGYFNIIVGYDTGNKKSESFAKSLGFKEYKELENTHQKNGININTYLMILSKEDWSFNN